MNAIRRAIVVEDDRPAGDSRWVTGRRGNCRLFVIQTGVGPARAESVCRKVLARQPLDLAVASGFACALTPCGIGDLLIGTDVIRHDGRDQAQGGVLHCADDWRTLALHAAREAGIPARDGRFITVSRVLWQATEKQRIAATTGAVGLDMESAGIGAAAAERDISFLVIRAVSDLVDEDLPFDFNRYLAGGWSRAVLACLAKPSRLVGLNRLRRQAAVAVERMTRFYGKFLDSLPSEV